mgnify:CR=1 FL=1
MIHHIAAVLYTNMSVDLYYNFRIVNRISNDDAKIIDIAPSRDGFCFLTEDNESVFQIAYSWKEMMSYSTSIPVTFSQNTDIASYWAKIPHYTIRLFALVYSDMFQIGSHFCCTHGRFISMTSVG